MNHERNHRSHSQGPRRPHGNKGPATFTPNDIQTVTLSAEQQAESQRNFSALGLSADACAAAASAGFVSPTPIQEHTIPSIGRGKDVLGLARTGSGKTAAYLLPLVGQRATEAQAPAVVVLVPTRELAIQVDEQARLFGSVAEWNTVVTFGGVSLDQQEQRLRGQRTDVVVATPGRLLDLRERGILDLRSVRTVILDEADRMLDLGFSEQIRALLTAMQGRTQTLLFSATMPTAVERLAQFYLKDPERIDVNPKTIIGEQIDQKMIEVRLTERMPKLLELVRESMAADDTVLIFAQTKVNVEMLYERLLRENIPAERLHSGLTQPRRIRVLEELKSGSLKVLVATDVAARGLDIPSIGHVINYEMPDTVDEYVHRIGRTGRYDRKGRATSLVTPEKRFMIPSIEMAMKQGRNSEPKSAPRSMSFRPMRRR